MAGIWDPLTIGKVTFRNRIVRSSVGGRTCNYDGTLTDVWKNFEKRFADGGIGGMVSTTFAVNAKRVSPLQYPSLADDRNNKRLARYLAEIKEGGCKYIVQIGDPGYATQTSLFTEPQDAWTSSNGWDFNFGYNNRRVEMQGCHIDQSIQDFGKAAVRAMDAGADGIEVTAAKGYLIHQFLSPAINRRDDSWGGGFDNRFKLLERVIQEVQKTVGRDTLLGVRLAHDDFATKPWLFSLLRWPQSRGNDTDVMCEVAARLKAMGVHYLHICGGYGFPNPFDIPGRFPTAEIRMHFNAVRHLSAKAWIRALLFNSAPIAIADWLANIGWKVHPGINLPGAMAIRKHLGDPSFPIIVNGGFQTRQKVEEALASGMAMVSMARALIANPNLLQLYQQHGIPDGQGCSYCSKCVGRTPTSPLGCYDVRRFPAATPLAAQRRMQEQIMDWNRADA